jgi:hypothetical protein
MDFPQGLQICVAGDPSAMSVLRDRRYKPGRRVDPRTPDERCQAGFFSAVR